MWPLPVVGIPQHAILGCRTPCNAQIFTCRRWFAATSRNAGATATQRMEPTADRSPRA